MRNNDRTIILKGGDGFMPFGKSDIAFSYYSSYWLPIRIIRKIARKLRINFFYPVFYGRWKRRIRNTDLIIMFDAGIENANNLARYVKQVNPRIRIVFWYWNLVNDNKSALNSKFVDEVWTYNRFDAKKYNLKYNCQFYPQSLANRGCNDQQNVFTDIIFLGTDKGRRQVLDELRTSAEKQGLKCNFTIVQSKKDSIEYSTYIDYVSSSKCIVDITPNQLCGLTIRPLEALALEKKLITNYEDIINYDFYDRENIFILGKDNIAKLAEFVNSPYRKIDKKILNFYSYESWLKRIERNEDMKL